MRIKFKLIVFLAIPLSGCGSGPDVYQLAIGQAVAKLEQEKFVALRRNRQCGIVIKIVPDRLSDDHIKWKVYSSGREMFWFAVHLTPVGPDATRVTVEIAKTPRGVEYYSDKYETPRPAMSRPAKPAIEEAIAAVLEGRPFDPSKAPSPAKDQLCGVQRGAISGGKIFSVEDEPADNPTPIGS